MQLENRLKLMKS